MATVQHVPVLAEEVMAAFAPHDGDRLLDATLGHGGHAEKYLQVSAPSGSVVGLDADVAALSVARERLKTWAERVTYVHANFAHLLENAPGPFQHILFDLGIGSHQLADETRGFSFSGTGGLSMRYGSAAALPAAKVAALNRLERKLGFLPDVGDILRFLSEEEIADIIWTYGEERFRGRIARALRQAPVPQSGEELAERVSGAVPAYYRRGRLHPATRTFQALRLAVNRELEALAAALPQARQLLAPGGKLAVISFHSLEDRLVKQEFRRFAGEGGARLLTKKPLRPEEHEMAVNPRARSAKLRILQRDG